MHLINQVTDEMLSMAPKRVSDILVQRFGLGSQEPKTLEAIAGPLGITRERVRQIQEEGMKQLLEKSASNKNLTRIALYARENLSKDLGVAHHNDIVEDLALRFGTFRDNDKEELGRKIIFLLRLVPSKVFYHPEDDYHHHFFAVSESVANVAKQKIRRLVELLKEREAIHREELAEILSKSFGIRGEAPERFLNIIKIISYNPFEEIGLVEHPRIVPKNTRDRLYVVLLKHGEPLHFRELARRLNDIAGREEINHAWRKIVNQQTVHNDLIRDERFVLIGRGIYALREWNFQPGTVKDVLVRILKEKKRLSQEELLKQTLLQRQVRPTTILINLKDKKTFVRTPEGKYALR